MRILVLATDIPEVPGLTLGVQRRGRPAELLDPVDASTTREAAWTLLCDVRDRSGTPDVTGPYVEGRPGGRFVYLSWLRDDDVVRRAKLLLEAVPADVLTSAREGGTLEARLGLTDDRGGPLCAAVRPPRVTWSASTAPTTAPVTGDT